MIQELKTNYGTMFVPDTDNGQYGWLKATGASPEDEFVEEVCTLLAERPKGCAVDVGANFGCWTMPLSKTAHHVVAIEPQLPCFELLKRSCRANRLNNIDCFNVAAGDKPGKILVPKLDLDADTNFGGISLDVPHHEQPDAPMTKVPMVRVDDLVRVDCVTFIKIDVEGFEERVLMGTRDTIARCRPILFVEVDHPSSDKEKLINILESFGYALSPRGGNVLGMPL